MSTKSTLLKDLPWIDQNRLVTVTVTFTLGPHVKPPKLKEMVTKVATSLEAYTQADIPELWVSSTDDW